MKIVGINASPREESNTRIAIQAALEEAKVKGADIQIFDITKMNITPCQADNACKANGGKCVIDDEMQEIYAAINEADGVILGTPIYWYNVSAQLKLVMDRMYSYYMTPAADQLKGKKVAIISSQAADDEGEYDKERMRILKSFEALGFEIVADEGFAANNNPAEIVNKSDDLKRATAIGDKMVE
ncbi:flavodoxin family protein [Methanosphaera cuniculi]|uniref:flavodoxin family protein n=1 Tax=Methanosphaera cuniculi TaxID=1077256 RepID=UPI0026EE80F3|nr:flavodoxin family protein [Methanosphaera cuniculi]